MLDTIERLKKLIYKLTCSCKQITINRDYRATGLGWAGLSLSYHAVLARPIS